MKDEENSLACSIDEYRHLPACAVSFAAISATSGPGEIKIRPRPDIPNYLKYLDWRLLKKIKPDAVGLIH
ncbi:MAG: hypothetical protein ABSG75_02495 [Syntrophales bacterium]|jgi:hypothetical protein